MCTEKSCPRPMKARLTTSAHSPGLPAYLPRQGKGANPHAVRRAMCWQPWNTRHVLVRWNRRWIRLHKVACACTTHRIRGRPSPSWMRLPEMPRGEALPVKWSRSSTIDQNPCRRGGDDLTGFLLYRVLARESDALRLSSGGAGEQAGQTVLTVPDRAVSFCSAGPSYGGRSGHEMHAMRAWTWARWKSGRTGSL